ncbi:iron hydrogenase [Pyrrhoderma noxium]|uniref:Iron hydrogenase n=1 Tax=Pyrrhoderma noxium TaxID=2282107 RepID=A0A286UGP6_9AGAM|nr:iron hydrogenase [Pyrrhoderma noxium]
MAFSGALTLTDLNDFITPSQACIKPVEQTNAQETRDQGAASTQIHIDASGSYYEVSKSADAAARKLETAQINLNDCLACSGCITSAESVLITMQSHEEVASVLSSNPPTICVDHKTPVLSISPQSLASLAASVASSSNATVTLSQILRRVTAFALSIGFEHVYDTTFARHLALLEHAREFEERKAHADSTGKLPMLASACPGQTKSPQQMMGTLVKKWLAQKWGKKPSHIYHVTVMPCYDKKLEASRTDFYDETYATRDVDCVITTGELYRMMQERAYDLSSPLPGESHLANELNSNLCDEMRELDHPIGPVLPELLTHAGSSSGSYLHSLLNLYVMRDSSLELTTRQVRGSEFEEYILRASGVDNKIVFKAARCYGFRSLQNVVRRVGRAAGLQVGRGAAGRLAAVRVKRRVKSKNAGTEGNEDENDDSDRPYDYVEVMACPSGCVNGGGQLRPPVSIAQSIPVSTGPGIDEIASNPSNSSPAALDSRWGDREWTKKVEQAYWHDLPTPPPSPSKTPRNLDPLTSTTASSGSIPTVSSVPSASARLQKADDLALSVLSDLTQTPFMEIKSWATSLGETAEDTRRKLFRTEYHAVESEVAGIQVQW